MCPALQEGDELLISRRKRVSIGEIVVFPDPRDLDVIMVKRVKRLTSPDKLWVEGDNATESTDSRTFGAIKRAELIGVVTSILTQNI